MSSFHNPPRPFEEMHDVLVGAVRGRDQSDLHDLSTRDDQSTLLSPPSIDGGAEEAANVDVPYVELHAHSAYSFLDGASMPEALVAEARRLKLRGLALTDHDGFYGAARMAEAVAETSGPPLSTLYGAELSLDLPRPQTGVPDPTGEHLLVIARGADGYRALAGAITDAQLAGGEKGRPVYDRSVLARSLRGRVIVLTGCRKSAVRRALEPKRGQFDLDAAARSLEELRDTYGSGAVRVELFSHGDPLDDDRNDALAALAERLRIPLVATGAVHYATPERYRLAQVLAAVRSRRSLDDMDSWLEPGAFACLRSGMEMRERFGRYPGAVENTLDVAAECGFPLHAVSPHLPGLDLPGGRTPMEHLRALAWEGARRKYPHLTERHRVRIEHELDVIEQKDFPGYFLIVYDIVRFARSRGILCQGRGSAAASAVCYLLDITAVDAIGYDLPFERFLSTIRDEEPDIDVDFDSDRREEVIQYVYEKYGRRNAAQVADVISFTPRNAVRDMARALGYGPGQQDAWSKGLDHRHLPTHSTDLEGDESIPDAVLDLAGQLQGHPRHLGIHSGGMVLTAEPVGEVVPVEYARMPGRTVLQWDKDDCEWMGLVKFDLLGLGIFTALQRTFDLVDSTFGRRLDLDAIPKEEPAVYDMLCRADAIGVFQVESRAQLGLLPRLRPRCFYDLTIEVAMIRPGPIQGGAVHPFIERRNDASKVRYLHPLLKPILGRTLGIPVFQEQIIQMATALSDLNPEEADLLRRAFGSKRGRERIDSLHTRMVTGMQAKGMSPEAIDAVCAQIEAFANFGFAESHSLSFALLVYASAWLKLHYPAAYVAGLLSAQPMGFYSPSSLVSDARRHGVEVRRPDVLLSGVDAELEPRDGDIRKAETPGQASALLSESGRDVCLERTQPPVGAFDLSAPDSGSAHRRDKASAVRLGLAAVRGVGRRLARNIVTERERLGPYRSMADLARRTGASQAQLEALSTAGAFDGLGMGRREALWTAGHAAQDRPEFLPGTIPPAPIPLFEVPDSYETLVSDLWATGVSPDDHRMRYARPALVTRGVLRSIDLRTAEVGRRITVAGVVVHRQRPSTAGGMVFLNLEDETGMVNVICSAGAWTRFRRVARRAPALIVRGMLERSPEGVVNVVADWFEELDLGMRSVSRDFR